jgi:hypothetical protein
VIIETSANELYRVRETGNPDLAHIWLGIPVKRTKAGFVLKAEALKANFREHLVRKAACRFVSAA